MDVNDYEIPPAGRTMCLGSESYAGIITDTDRKTAKNTVTASVCCVQQITTRKYFTNNHTDTLLTLLATHSMIVISNNFCTTL
jgi:hypothetical protein